MKLLLAASGGGHIRQLIDLKPFWAEHDFVFASEGSQLARSLESEGRVRYFAHFAFGQRLLQGWGAMLRSAVANMRDSWRIIAEERPDVVVSSGAGSAMFCVLFGKLRGAEIVIIESFARFTGPSLFGRLTKPFATHAVVQSAGLAARWPDAHVCDPFEIVDAPRPPKEPLALVTVGTVLTFDRLVAGVAKLKADGLLPERVVAQVGKGGATPPGLECTEGLGFREMQDLLARADIVFCHAGTGSMVTALRAGCRLIVMPRLPERKELYDDHQRDIVEAFAKRGLIQPCIEADDLPAALAQARVMTVRSATTDPRKLIGLLRGWYPAKR